MAKDIDPRTGRSKADTAKIQAKWEAKQASLEKQNKATKRMLQQAQSRKKADKN